MRYLTAHLFVQAADNHIALTILDEVIRPGQRNRTSFGFTDTYNYHLDAFFFGTFGNGYGVIFVVLAIGDQDDRTAGVTLLTEATDGGTQGSSDSRSLCLDEFRLDGVEEHLRRHIIAGDRQLNERVAGKDDETHFVIHHVVHQFAQHLFGAVQTVRRYIFGEHRIGDIECHNRLDSLPFLRALRLTELRPGGSDDK